MILVFKFSSCQVIGHYIGGHYSEDMANDGFLSDDRAKGKESEMGLGLCIQWRLTVYHYRLLLEHSLYSGLQNKDCPMSKSTEGN